MTNPNDTNQADTTTSTEADYLSKEYVQLSEAFEAGDVEPDTYFQEYVYGPGEEYVDEDEDLVVAYEDFYVGEDEDLVEPGEGYAEKALSDSPELLKLFFSQSEYRLDSWWVKDRDLFKKTQAMVSRVLGFDLPMVPDLKAAEEKGFQEDAPWTESPEAPFHWRAVIALTVEALEPTPYSIGCFSYDLLADYPDVMERMKQVEEELQIERDKHMTE